MTRIVTISLFLFVFKVFSSEPVVAPTIQTEVEQQQAERLKEIRASQKSLESLTQLPPSHVGDLQDETRCFVIQTFEIDGNEAVSGQTLLALIQGNRGRCLGTSGINEILKALTNHYISLGYVTSRAVLPAQDLTSGILRIVIAEGKLESFQINGSMSEKFYSAFPYLVGEILNLRDIEQGLDQINRLSRYDAKISMLPGTDPGFTIVSIETRDMGAFSYHAGFNNAGQKSAGETQLTTQLRGENLLGLLDNWVISGNKSSEFATDHDATNARLSLSVPFGYYSLGYSYSYSDYKTTFLSNGFPFKSDGKTQTHESYVDWLFSRNNISKSSLKFSVNHRREKNYINDTLLVTSSRNLSHVSLGITHSTRFLGGFLTFAPRYIRGATLFNSESDAGKRQGQPLAEFNKADATLSYSYPLATNTFLTTTVFGQWSDDKLYGSQRLSVGGLYSVRGFKEQSISGDTGYYWRNDITYRLEPVPYLAT